MAVTKPSRLTEPIITALADRVRAIFWIEHAAKSLGLNPATVRDWMTTGRDNPSRKRPTALHIKLVEEIEKARAEYAVQLNVVAKQACFGATVTRTIVTKNASGQIIGTQEISEVRPPDSRVLRFLLERTDNVNFGRRDHLTIEANIGTYVLEAPPKEDDLEAWKRQYSPHAPINTAISGNGHDSNGSGRPESGNGHSG